MSLTHPIPPSDAWLPDALDAYRTDSPFSWLCLALPGELARGELGQSLQRSGLPPFTTVPPMAHPWGDGRCFVFAVNNPWPAAFKRLCGLLAPWRQERISAAVLPAGAMPSQPDAVAHLRPLADLSRVADHVWLCEAIRAGHLAAHLQTVVDRHSRIAGYEAYARVLNPQGADPIEGGRIFAAAEALGIQHLLDQYLQVHAVNSFASHGLHGTLFVNCLASRVDNPEAYLRTLQQAFQRAGLPAERIVLELTGTEGLNHVEWLAPLAYSCRAHGFRIAYDDVRNANGAEMLLRAARPDILKLHRSLTAELSSPGGQQQARTDIAAITAMATAAGTAVAAKAIEDELTYQTLLPLGVTYFQGYRFSRPQPADAWAADEGSTAPTEAWNVATPMGATGQTAVCTV